ncbi:MAG: metallophosphoesterase [Planctomycetes bacterium]|nr:metallophosphoesterase [Planctomycetota bacterium]
MILGTHWFVYFSVIRFFAIEKRRGIKILFYVGIAVSFSFILASFLARVDSSWLIRLFYIASSLWLGYLVNFLLASVVLWVLRGPHRLIKCRADFRIISIVIFAFFFLFSSWGVYHASDVKVKNFDVILKDLPATWQGKRVMQVSDTHFGQVYGVKSVQRLLDLVNQEKPDLIVITGDLFDGTDGNMDQLISHIGRLKAPMGVYFTTGNHDFYAGEEKLDTDLKKVGINLLSNGFVDLNGVQLAGINYAFQLGGMSYQDQIHTWQNYSSAKPTILLHHVPDKINEFADAGIDLLLAGHTHRGQLFPFGLITDFIFKGFDHGLNTFGDLQVYTSSGAGTWGAPMRTSADSEIPIFKLR